MTAADGRMDDGRTLDVPILLAQKDKTLTYLALRSHGPPCLARTLSSSNTGCVRCTEFGWLGFYYQSMGGVHGIYECIW
jgi:hypothetical protein